MMRIKRGIGFLMVLSLVTAGCAKSNFNLSSRERGTLTTVQEARSLNAKEAPMPSILPKTRYAAARLFEEQGRLDQAFDQYRRAVASDPTFAAAHHRIALLLSKVSRHDEAIEAFQRAVKLDRKNARLRNNFGFELMFAQRWTEAEAQLHQAIELEPSFARAHVNLAMALSKQDRFDEALGAFQRVLPEPDAYYNLGLLYRGQRDYGQASKTFQHVLTLNPNFTAARKQLAELAKLVGGHELGERAQRFANATGSSTIPPVLTSKASSVTPRRVDRSSSTAVNKPVKTFWKAARQPKAAPSDAVTVRDFTSISRIASEPIEVGEPVQVSWIDEYPMPTPLDDFASTVAMIDDEVNCVREEIQRANVRALVDSGVVAAAFRHSSSPYRARVSGPPAGKGVFSQGSLVRLGSTFEDVEANCAEDSVVTMRHTTPLLASPPRRVASAVASASGVDDMRTPYVDLPLAGSAVGTAFARGTWADDAPSKNPKFSHRNDLASMNAALRRVRIEIESLKNEDRRRAGAYAAARSESYQSRLTVAPVVSRPVRKYAAAPTTLRDFATFQLDGADPETLASIVGAHQAQTRQSTKRPVKSMLVGDKPVAPKTPRRGRPRTDARSLDTDLPIKAFHTNDRWFTPPMVMGPFVNDGIATCARIASDAWLRDFDELDGLLSVIRNEILCEGTIKAELVIPAWTRSDELDCSTLELEPIMSVLPDSAYTPVCDPNQPDGDHDTIILGAATGRTNDLMR